MRRASRPPLSSLALLLLASPTGAASPEFHQAVSDSAPVLHYRFAEETGPAENFGSLGATYDASYEGTPLRAAAGLGGDAGVGFDDASDYLQSFAAAPAAFTGNPTFTVEAVVWAPSDGAAVQYPPFLHWGPAADGEGVFFGFARSLANQAIVGFYNGALGTPIGSLPTGRWHHLIWVRSGGAGVQANQGSTLYVDGADVTASLLEDPTLTCNACVPVVGSTEFRVNRARDLEGTRHFDGVLDEVALYDRALAPAEALAHFRALVDIFDDGFESEDTSAWSLTVGGP